MDSDRPKETQVQPYSPGGANVLYHEGALALRHEYDWTIRLAQRRGLMSNYFDQFFFIYGVFTVDILKRVLHAMQMPVSGNVFLARSHPGCPRTDDMHCGLENKQQKSLLLLNRNLMC